MAFKKKSSSNLPPWRPREHDRDQVASELIEWARKEDSINLCGFCTDREHPIVPSKLSQWADQDDNFRQALEITRAFLGSRREKLLNQERLHVKGYDLNATTYDIFLDEKKEKTSRFESSLRKEEDKKPTEINIKVSNDGLGRGIGVSAKRLSTTNNRSS